MSENEIDIFKTTVPQNGEFFKFQEVGDGIQGTYVDKREGKDGFGNDQIIYVLKAKDGKMWNAAFRRTSTVIHERMKDVKLGQIVGFKFDDYGQVKRGPNAGTKFKIVNAYADPKLVDKEWLAAHPGATVPATSNTVASTPTARVETGSADEDAEAMTAPYPTEEEISSDSLDAIRSLARSKGLVTEGMTDAQADEAIVNYVGMDLSEENLPKIIIKLTSYSK